MAGLRLRAVIVLAVLVLAVFVCDSTHAVDKLREHRAHTGAEPGYRFERGGWTYVHLEGTPSQIGFEHGSLLAPEIADMVRVNKLETLHSTHRDWEFYREAGKQDVLAPHRDRVSAGARRHRQGRRNPQGVKLDVWDIVALNGSIELPEYYVPWLNKNQKAANAPHILPQGRCSAFIATGSYTKDGKIVIAHNNWSSYAEGERWTIIFDIQPEHGHHILMDGEPGRDHQPGRLRGERCWPDDHRDDDHPVRGLESRWHSGVCALAQGHAICRLHR